MLIYVLNEVDVSYVYLLGLWVARESWLVWLLVRGCIWLLPRPGPPIENTWYQQHTSPRHLVSVPRHIHAPDHIIWFVIRFPASVLLVAVLCYLEMVWVRTWNRDDPKSPATPKEDGIKYIKSDLCPTLDRNCLQQSSNPLPIGTLISSIQLNASSPSPSLPLSISQLWPQTQLLHTLSQRS